MADTQFNAERDLSIKPGLTQFRKISGKVVETELELPSTSDEDGIDGLLDGIEGDEIDEGRERLFAENPELAQASMHDYLEDTAASIASDGNEFYEPKRAASSKRSGSIMDNETSQTFAFRRVNAGADVELIDSDDGAILDTLASSEFDDFLDTGDYTVL